MATIINNPPGTAEASGVNAVMALILIIVILGGGVLFFMYGLPMIQNNQAPTGTNINVTVPAVNTPANAGTTNGY